MGYADIKLGYACNNKCVHCVIVDQRKKANDIRGNANRTTEESKSEILDSANNGFTSIVLTGGEPTIRKDFEELLQYAKSLGLNISVQTNGRRFCDLEFAKRVVPYVENVVIAVHGPSAAVHDKVTLVDGSFDETIEGIKNLVFLNAKVAIKMVLSTINAHSIVDTVKLMEELRAIYMNIAFPHACEELLYKYEELVPYYKDLREEVESSIDYIKEKNLNVEFETILPCALNRKDGLKYFSDFKYYKMDTELKQLDTDTIEWNKIRKTIKRKTSRCNECIYNSICEGYWMEYISIRGDKEFSPIKQGMKIAKSCL